MTTDSKATLRARARAARRDLVARRDLQADAGRFATLVLALIAGHPDALDGGVCRVAAYVAYGTEPPTHLLVAALEAAGHDVVLPRLLDDRSLDWTRDGLALGASAITTAAVIVTPGLAVDRQRTRLGQGGGSYDRALLRRRPDALVVTLLHDGELSETPLPRDRHDQPVDGVVTPDAGWLDLR
ncbi:MAG: 5-formyltetrahydrofolate cyclo-ligase [Lapillicoccus sp.]